MRKHFTDNKLILFFILLICVILPFSVGYNQSKPSPEKQYMVMKPVKLFNSDSEFETFQPMEKSINRFIKRYRIPGASVAISKNGKLVYAKGFGVADTLTGKSVEPYHRFRIASVSKLVTAVAVMKLVQDGKMKLDDPVFGEEGLLNDSIYNSHITDKNYYKIKLRHLLDHTAGWSTRSYGDPMFKPHLVARSLGKEPPVMQDDIIEFVLRRYLPYKPGTYYNYSNFGYMLLGKIIEKQSGKSYEKYVKEDILLPLSIFDMQLAKNCYEDRAEEEVAYYDYQGARERLSIYGSGELMPKPYGGTDIVALEGAGGWIASPAQFLRLVNAIDGFEDREDILNKETIKKMVTVPGPGYHPIGWRGVSSRKWYRTGTLAGSSALVVRRSDSISYVVLMNSGTWRGSRFNNQVNYMMRKALDKVDEWPQQDLFENYELAFSPVAPVPNLD